MPVKRQVVEPDYTVPEVARILRVAQVKVRKWIHRGELVATNISNSKSRPSYTVTREALAEFRRRRSPAQPTLFEMEVQEYV